jgi:mRNA interferase RelE/StbE
VIVVGIRKAGDKKDIYELMKKLIRTGIVENDGIERREHKSDSY